LDSGLDQPCEDLLVTEERDHVYVGLRDQGFGDLHVLLRPRLLVEAEVGQPRPAIEVDEEPAHLAGTQMKQVDRARLHLAELQSARLTAPAAVAENKHALSVELAILVSDEADFLKPAQEVTKALYRFVYPRPPTRRRSIGKHVLDLGMYPLDRAEVPAFPIRVDRAHEVQVLRHRPRSIAQECKPFDEGRPGGRPGDGEPHEPPTRRTPPPPAWREVERSLYPARRMPKRGESTNAVGGTALTCSASCRWPYEAGFGVLAGDRHIAQFTEGRSPCAPRSVRPDGSSPFPVGWSNEPTCRPLLRTLSLFVVAAGKHLVSATRGRAGQLVREPVRLVVPLDLALAARPGDPEAVFPERVDGDLTDARNGPVAFVSQGSGAIRDHATGTACRVSHPCSTCSRLRARPDRRAVRTTGRSVRSIFLARIWTRQTRLERKQRAFHDEALSTLGV